MERERGDNLPSGEDNQAVVRVLDEEFDYICKFHSLLNLYHLACGWRWRHGTIHLVRQYKT